MAEDAPLPNLMQLTPLNPTFKEDPHVLLDDLRARCPVHHDSVSGSFVLTRYADVRKLVSDRTLVRDPLNAEEGAFLSRRFLDEVDLSLPRSETTSILMLDDPDHGRIRGPLSQALYARVAKFKPEVERIVKEALDKLEGQKTFDLMSAYCVPIPIDVIASILGVEHERLAEFRDWSEGVIQSLNPFRTEEQTAHLIRSGEAFTAYWRDMIIKRRADPKDDLISDMVRLQAEGVANVSDEELRINLGALLVGGNLTTTDLIGNAVRLFLRNPGELEKLRADPSLIASAVEETLRYEPPVDITGRIANADMEVGGCPVKPHQTFTFSLRGANRDPDMFEDPHSFNITRTHKPHVAFGGGAHICIGAPLARLEAQVAIWRLFERFPTLRLADPDAPAQWRSLPFFRGLERLELAV